MNPFRTAILVFLLVLVFAPLHAQEDGRGIFGDLSITYDPPPDAPTDHGYVEYRFFVTNHSAVSKHHLELNLPDRKYPYYGQSVRQIKRQGMIAPGETVIFTMFQPPLDLEGVNAEVIVDGRQSDDRLILRPPRHMENSYYSGSSAVPTLLFSRSLKRADLFPEEPTAEAGSESEELSESSSVSVKKAKKPRPASLNLAMAENPAKEWSTNWLGYTRYSGIALTGEDLAHMSSELLSVMQRYVEAGGCLAVFGSANLPQNWRMVDPPAAATIQDDDALQKGYREYRGGFGTCLVITSPATVDRQFGIEELLRKNLDRSRNPCLENNAPEDANRSFSITDGEGIPVRGLMVLITIFSLIIGPANFYFLNLRGKRIWILWTTPLISLFACISVVLYAGLGEGWSARCRTETLTILDEESKRASTIGWAAYYSPLTVGDGFHFTMNTEVMMQSGRGYRYNSRTMPRSVDWSKDQHLFEGWILPRVPTHFRVRKSELRRERMTIRSQENGTVRVVNGLGVMVNRFFWEDEKGGIFTAEMIPPGKEVSLNISTIRSPHHGDRSPLRDEFQGHWRDFTRIIQGDPASILEPMSWLALTDSSPFLEDGVANVSSRQDRAIIFGLSSLPENLSKESGS